MDVQNDFPLIDYTPETGWELVFPFGRFSMPSYRVAEALRCSAPWRDTFASVAAYEAAVPEALKERLKAFEGEDR
jgi:hypothetical protein